MRVNTRSSMMPALALNSTNLTIKFMHKSDADILGFLEGKSKATVIKAAIREYMENHKEGTE